MVLAPIVAMCALAAGCVAGWDGRVERFGTLREVLRDGEVQGRVRVADVADRPGVVALGALADLRGEVTVIEGETWLARPVGDGRIAVARGSADDAQAAFLALAIVDPWRTIPIEAPVEWDALDPLVSAAAARAGLGRLDTIPFVIEGELHDLHAHVLDGRCPFAADPERRGEPVRFAEARARGRLVGFLTTLPAGTLTHHGSRLHVHVVLDGPGAASGHVDSVAIATGRLRLPAR